VRLAGSRSRGEETELSDWDFAIEAPDFDAAARALPELVGPLRPLAEQWDRLSPFPTYMLMLRGPVKVDFLFLDETLEPEPPWEVGADTLEAVDRHFWDWVLWLAGKELAGRHELIAAQPQLLFDHLLGPMGATQVPSGASEALAAYLERRAALERGLGTTVPRELEREVRPVVEAALRVPRPGAGRS
jgi:hypothetical protein